ncbi:DUF3187 family protein [Vibrio marisflavi]|uniref:DUF3187 family protein n=1 Tax=Vibrio marisflavi CECT 7928 TaxID=634439 RepID=A0ABM9A022_9VIBR|nr:DUF3187 family protein [Vibrio marisflavi]CAH0536138.1 hypothetical protein VMF7928_00232 [Vibrio marisflavi CECT 7928]
MERQTRMRTVLSGLLSSLCIFTPSLIFAEELPNCEEDGVQAECKSSRHSSPFRTYAASPLQALSLTTQLRSAELVDDAEVFLVGSVASVWAQGRDIQLDYYQNQVMSGVAWRVSESWSAEVKYQLAWSANNHLDTLTIDFHDFVGISQNGRQDEDKHQNNIDSSTYNIAINDFDSEVMVNAVHGYLQWQAFRTSHQAFSFGATLYYNKVSNSPFAASTFDQAFQINYSLFYGASSFFTTIGGTLHSSDEHIFETLPVKRFTGAWAFGYGYRLARNHELMFEYHGYEGMLEHDEEFTKASQEVVLGYRYYLKDLAQFELSATENIYNMSNSTDIVFSLGMRFFLDSLSG